MSRRPNQQVRLVEAYPGSTEVSVYRPGNKEPHFIVYGVSVTDLDPVKLVAYMYECDWTDRGARGWITPRLRCDEFLKEIRHE